MCLNNNGKRLWLAQEDRLLYHVVETLAVSNWEKVSAFFDGRTGKQCRERWINHVSPNVKKTEWSPEEDKQLLDLVGQLGTKWSVIAQHMPGRTDNAIKNRYFTFVRKGAVPRPASWNITAAKYTFKPEQHFQLLQQQTQPNSDEDDSKPQEKPLQTDGVVSSSPSSPSSVNASVGTIEGSATQPDTDEVTTQAESKKRKAPEEDPLASQTLIPLPHLRPEPQPHQQTNSSKRYKPTPPQRAPLPIAVATPTVKIPEFSSPVIVDAKPSNPVPATPVAPSSVTSARIPSHASQSNAVSLYVPSSKPSSVTSYSQLQQMRFQQQQQQRQLQFQQQKRMQFEQQMQMQQFQYQQQMLFLQKQMQQRQEQETQFRLKQQLAHLEFLTHQKQHQKQQQQQQQQQGNFQAQARTTDTRMRSLTNHMMNDSVLQASRISNFLAPQSESAAVSEPGERLPSLAHLLSL